MTELPHPSNQVLAFCVKRGKVFTVKIALMQPYFFPYLGYFQLISSVDEFVIFDEARYVRRSWMNRNRILNEHKESVFMTVPVCKAKRETKIIDIAINNDTDWKAKILNQCIYYKNAPNYLAVREILEECFLQDETSLSEFNTSLLKMVCTILGIETTITKLSEKFPQISYADESDDWGLQVSKAYNATTYINAIGGRDFYNQQKYLNNGIDIKFIQSILTPYKQFDKGFVSGLSIIDIMMFNDFSSISQMLDHYELIS